MRNTANVISLIDRHQNCDDCRLSGECLVRVDDVNSGGPRAGMPVSGHVIRRGTHVFRMGDPFDTLYSVRSGAVKTYRLTASGEQQVTGFYLPGDVFGLDSVERDTYASNAVALDTTCICAFGYDRLKSLCRNSAEVNGRLTRRLGHRIRDGERTLMVLGHKSADERLAWFLVELSKKQARLGLSSTDLNLVMPRTDISSYLMLAVETVSRVLTRLQEAGLIRVNRNRIIVDIPRELARLAGFESETDDNSRVNAGAG
ncbi:MAG: cyclic nucleotide-binding domain-containing protein [Gammaproteobacteria bacterium]|nr:cyclic nucleotide-binding domain-containing protein [Gammaproteobacteria bacterium]